MEKILIISALEKELRPVLEVIDGELRKLSKKTYHG